MSICHNHNHRPCREVLYKKQEPHFPQEMGFLVPVTGIEPVRLLGRGILSPLCLPVPPHRRNSYLSTDPSRRQGKKGLTFPLLWCKMGKNFIGQFVTILSVNKTRILGGRICAHFLFMGTVCCSHFIV